MKQVPVLNATNKNDSTFMHMGRMPRIIDKRLEMLGHEPDMMSARDKKMTMHGEPA